jgi:hypothetical protein
MLHRLTLMSHTNTSNQQPSIVDQPPESEHSWIPDGCVILVGPDGKRYVVPAFMGPAMRQAFEGQKKKDLMTFGASGTVSLFMCPACLFSSYLPAPHSGIYFSSYLRA